MKTAFVTLVDDKFLPGFFITVNSLLGSTKNFNYDLVILDWGGLSDKNKQTMLELYPGIKFKSINVQDYQQCIYDNTWREWTYNCNYRFDIFLLSEYERVIYFDCDIIFRVDANEILKHNINFGACPSSPGRIKQINKKIGFEGGFLSVGSKYLIPETRQKLIELSLTRPPYDKNVPARKWMSDEPILNTYFLDKINWLPEKYNTHTDKVTSSKLYDSCNIQFIGHNKPWYGEVLEDQFDSYVFKALAKLNGRYMTTILLKKLISLYNDEVNKLKQKNIDIYQYTGGITPINNT